jgi:hypothetical protein
MLGVIYFSWEVRRNWKEYRWRNLHLLYLFMAVYLLKGSKDFSMTSVSVCVFALGVFLRIQSLRSRPSSIARFVRTVFYATTALILLVITHSVVNFSEGSFFGHMITLFGKDITMTGRTEIWRDVYAVAGGFTMLGVGFGGFWIGRIANIPWNAHMTWVLGQGHSGYVDTYLQLGFVGAFLLACVAFSTIPRLLASLYDDFDFACLRITLFLTILFVNITESTYLRGDHHLWLVMMLVVWNVPRVRTTAVGESDEKKEANWVHQNAESIPVLG